MSVTRQALLIRIQGGLGGRAGLRAMVPELAMSRNGAVCVRILVSLEEVLWGVRAW